MVDFVTIFHLFCHLLLLTYPSSSLPLCMDLRAPFIQKTPLPFCAYNGNVCCDSTKDVQLQEQFQAMNVSDPGCASLMKSIICAVRPGGLYYNEENLGRVFKHQLRHGLIVCFMAWQKCDQFSAELFKVELGPRQLPILCNSPALKNSLLSNKAASSFCAAVWDACQNVSISNSPFATPLQGKAGVLVNSTSSKLAKLWQSKNAFCNAFGGSSDDGAICFDGEHISLSKTDLLPLKGICLEKIGNGSYLNMVAHPDGSNRAFFSDQPGRIWLAAIPEQGSGGTLGLDESIPILDLSDKVYFHDSFGMMGMAFHPNFACNGRFFASFNCDKVKMPTCSGRCACTSDMSCDPSRLNSSLAAQPCRYHKVIAEFSANGTASEPSLAKSAKPSEVRRILTLGLPFAFNHGGQILFGPADGYLYVMMGDSGIGGDPINFSQNKRSLLGKILRLDVDNIPSTADVVDLGLWGTYSVPQENPYSEDMELQPEIWALGLRNPWRCSFDSERPLYFICADSGEDHYEEVDIITKGGNYGWNVYEGTILFNPQQSPGGNTSANSVNLIFPVLGYKHSDVNKNDRSAAICGGYFYRSTTDPCMYGSYLYADLYGNAIWAAAEIPSKSGNFTSTRIPFSCTHDSPIRCSFKPEGPKPDLGYIYSFGEDNREDIFILTSSGVYRIVRPSDCNYTCPKEIATAYFSPSPPSSSYRNHITGQHKKLIHFLFSFLLFLSFIL